MGLLISRARLTSILTDFQVDLGLINVLHLYLLFLLFLLLLNQVYGLIQLSVTIKSTFINLTLANAADLCLFARLLSCTQLDPTISDWKVDLIQFSSTFPSQLDVFKEPDLGLLT